MAAGVALVCVRVRADAARRTMCMLRQWDQQLQCTGLVADAVNCSCKCMFEACAMGALLCNATNWRKFNGCRQRCPLGLHISEPADLLGLHINHELKDRTLEVVTPGNFDGLERFGCLPEHYINDERNNGNHPTTNVFKDKIVIVRRGQCTFAVKAQMAATIAEAAALIVVDDRFVGRLYGDNVPHRMQAGAGSVASNSSNLVTILTPRQYGDPILKTLDEATPVMGTLKLDCAQPPEPMPDLIGDTNWDECPDHRLIGECQK
eukprot:gene55031-57834_t